MEPNVPQEAELVPNQDEKNMALIMHVLALIGFGLISTLIIWLLKKDESAFLNKAGKELLNFQISLLIYFLVSFVLCLVIIGFVLVGVLAIASLILTIIGLIRATEGKIYRFPLTIRML